MEKFGLAERVILLTGATGHLGQAIARALGAAGAHVVLGGRDARRLQVLHAALLAEGGQATILEFDVRDAHDRERAMASVGASFGRLDGIVNNAYAGKVGTIETITVEDFENAAQFNLSAPFHLVQLALPLLKQSGERCEGGASVVNVASMYGMVSPDPSIYGDSGANNPPHYGATKGGLIQLTRYLACHLAPWNIRVNSVSPGPFPPPEIRQSQPDFHATLCAKVPMKRIGAADEVAYPIQFLLGAGAAYITGADLPIDGGWTAW